MVICGSFVGEEEDDLYVWIRRFESEAQRVELYAAVYESDTWTKEIGPKIPALMDREQIKVRRLMPTDKSAIQ